MNAEHSPERKKLTRNEKIDFWAAYMKAVLNPWSDTAIEQQEAGDDTLIEGIKKRALRDTCAQFGVTWEQGVQIIAECFEFGEISDDTGPEDGA